MRRPKLKNISYKEFDKYVEKKVQAHIDMEKLKHPYEANMMYCLWDSMWCLILPSSDENVLTETLQKMLSCFNENILNMTLSEIFRKKDE